MLFGFDGIPELLAAVVTAASLMGGTIAAYSSYFAFAASRAGKPSLMLTADINRGVAYAFPHGVSFAVIGLILSLIS